MSDPLPEDWICLTELEFPCVVGLLDWEQRSPQRLAVEIAMKLDLDAAGGGDLTRTVDYAAVLEQVQFIAQHGGWRLLESMALAIVRQLLAPPAEEERRAQIEAARVKLSKTGVLGGRAVFTIEVNRHRSWYRPEARVIAENVRAEVLQETKESGAYRIRMAPRTAWTVPAGMDCMLVAGRVLSDGAELVSGDTLGRGGSTVESAGASCLLGVSHGSPILSTGETAG